MRIFNSKFLIISIFLIFSVINYKIIFKSFVNLIGEENFINSFVFDDKEKDELKYLLAIDYYYTKQYQEAVKIFLPLSTKNAMNNEKNDILNYLAMSQEKINLYDEAIKSYKKLLPLLNLDEKINIYKRLIKIYEKLDKYEEIIIIYNKIYLIDPIKYYYMDVFIGTIYANNKLFKHAYTFFEKFVNKYPNEPYAYIDLFALQLILNNKLDPYYKKSFVNLVNQNKLLYLKYEILLQMQNIIENKEVDNSDVVKKYKNKSLNKNFFIWFENWINSKNNESKQKLLNFINVIKENYVKNNE